MGSEGSKSSYHSSGSCQSSATTALEKHGGARADNEVTQMAYDGFVFFEKSIMARALDDKAAIETGRIIAETLFFGLAAISRATAGHSDHWAFIAKGRGIKKGKTMNVWYVAQFGDGDIVPTRFTGKDEVKLCGWVVTDLAAAERSICTIKENTNVWTQKKFIPCEKQRSLEDLEDLIKATPSAGKAYSAISNNCQHFAASMYKMA